MYNTIKELAILKEICLHFLSYSVHGMLSSKTKRPTCESERGRNVLKEVSLSIKYDGVLCATELKRKIKVKQVHVLRRTVKTTEFKQARPEHRKGLHS